MSGRQPSPAGFGRFPAVSSLRRRVCFRIAAANFPRTKSTSSTPAPMSAPSGPIHWSPLHSWCSGKRRINQPAKIATQKRKTTISIRGRNFILENLLFRRRNFPLKKLSARRPLSPGGAGVLSRYPVYGLKYAPWASRSRRRRATSSSRGALPCTAAIAAAVPAASPVTRQTGMTRTLP